MYSLATTVPSGTLHEAHVSAHFCHVTIHFSTQEQNMVLNLFKCRVFIGNMHMCNLLNRTYLYSPSIRHFVTCTITLLFEISTRLLHLKKIKKPRERKCSLVFNQLAKIFQSFSISEKKEKRFCNFFKVDMHSSPTLGRYHNASDFSDQCAYQCNITGLLKIYYMNLSVIKAALEAR